MKRTEVADVWLGPGDFPPLWEEDSDVQSPTEPLQISYAKCAASSSLSLRTREEEGERERERAQVAAALQKKEREKKKEYRREQLRTLNFCRDFFAANKTPTPMATNFVLGEEDLNKWHTSKGRSRQSFDKKLSGKNSSPSPSSTLSKSDSNPVLQNVSTNFSDSKIAEAMLDEHGEFGPENSNSNGPSDPEILALFQVRKKVKQVHAKERKRGRNPLPPPLNLAIPNYLEKKKFITQRSCKHVRMFSDRYMIQNFKHDMQEKIKNPLQAKIETVKQKLTPVDTSELEGKFYVQNMRLNGKITTDAFLDTGADINLIPLNVAKKLKLDLNNADKSNKISIVSYSKHEIPVKCAVWLTLSFDNTNFKKKELFLVTEDKGEEIILSKMLVRRYQIDIIWRKGNCFLKLKPHIYLSTKTKIQAELPPPLHNSEALLSSSPPPSSPSHTSTGLPPATDESAYKGRKNEFVPIFFSREEKLVANCNNLSIKPFAKQIVPVQYVDANNNKMHRKIVVTPITGVRRPVVITPSLSKKCMCTNKCNKYFVEVINYTGKEIQIMAGQLKGNASPVSSNSHFVVDATQALSVQSDGSPTQKARAFRKFCGTTGIKVEMYQVSNLDPAASNFIVRDADEQMFKESKEWSQIDEETGYPISPPHAKSAQDAIPWQKYDNEVKTYIHKIFIDRYSDVVSRGFFDCGNASKRGLGSVKIVTEGPPKVPAKMYPMSSKQRLSLLKILRGMISMGWAERCVAKYGSPCFIIPRKDPTEPGRLLVNLININQVCINLPHALMTSPLNLIQKLSGSYLMSTIDLKQAYSAFEIDEESQNKLVILTELGSFKLKRMPQGSSWAPAIFNAKIKQALYDDCVTSSLQHFSMPSEMEGISDKYNYLSNLSVHCVNWLDDIIVFTPKINNSHTESMEFHAQILDRCINQLSTYDFKINMKKSDFFKTKISVLGYNIENGTVKPDEARFNDIKVATFPSTRNKMLGFLSLCGTLRPSMSLRTHSELAHLFDLTSTKKKFEPTPRHFEAFEAVKSELAREPLITYLPDETKCKVLYCDASQQLLGAVLLQVDFKTPIITTETNNIDGKNFSIYDPLGNKIYKYCKDQEIKLSTTLIPADGNCFIHSVLDQLSLYNIDSNYPKNHSDFRAMVVSFLHNHSQLKKDSEAVRKVTGNQSWPTYIDELGIDGRPTDSLNIFIKGTADMLGRDIHIITSIHGQIDPIIISSSFQPHKLPPLFLGFYPPATDDGIGHYVSLVVNKPCILSASPFTSLSRERKWRELSQTELFNQVKKLWLTNEKDKPDLQVLSYMSKSIAKEEQSTPIYMLELKALLESLHSFRDLIACAPATVVLIDSRALWCLLNTGVTETVHRLHRWSVTIRERYKNLMFHLIPSGINIADYMSRQFNPKGWKPERLVLKQNFEGKVDELATKTPLTFEEAEKIANNNPQYLDKATTPQKRTLKANINNINLDKISEATLPIKQLQDKLTPEAVLTRQRAELSEEFGTALTVSPHKQHGESKLTINKGLLAIQRENDPVPLVYIPPSLEGLVLSYHHLITAHRLGRVGLYLAIKDLYYFPNLRQKCAEFCSLCLHCSIIHGIKGRKLPLGKTPLPSSPFTVLYLDVVTLTAKLSPKVSDYLVIVCPFSKYFAFYPCKKLTDDTIIQHLRTYFTHLGLITSHIIADNATIFRSQKFLTFCSKLGIRVVKSSAYRSQARGQCEIFNYLLKKVVTSFMLTKPNYAFEDITFLINIIMNNSLNLTTKHSPSDIVFGRSTLTNDGFGLSLQKPITTGSLLTASLATDVQNVRTSLDKIWKQTLKNIQKVRQKQATRYNKHAKTKDLKVGDLCFLLDRRLPKPGQSKKLDPPLQKSPFVIENVYSHAVDVVRIVDHFRTRVHPNDIKLIKDMNPDHPLYQDLPDSVREEIGRPLTVEQIKELAVLDDLPLLFIENFGRFEAASGSGIETRAARRKRALEEMAIKQAFEDPDPSEWETLDLDEDDDEDVDDLQLPKSVSFAAPTV